MARASVAWLVLPVAAAAASACGGQEPAAKSPGATAQLASQVGPVTSCARARATVVGRPPADQRGSSTIAVATLGSQTLAYVADEDTRSVRTIDVDTNKELATTPLDGRPGHMVVLPDGRVAVALRDLSKVEVLEPQDGATRPLEKRCAIDTAPEPVALAVTPDGATVLVSSGWGRALGAYDSKTFARAWEVPLPREPRAVVTSDDGAFAYVAHAVGGQVSRVDLQKHEAKQVPLHGKSQAELQKEAQDSPARFTDAKSMMAFQSRMRKAQLATPASCQGFALAKSEAPSGRILVPQVLVDPGDPDNTPTGYGTDNEDTETPDVAVIDSAAGSTFAASIERPQTLHGRVGETHEHDCLLPRAAAYDPSTKSVLVSCYGIDAVVAYDALAASPARAEKRRWTVAAGPSGVAVDAGKHRALVWSQFDRVMSVIKLDGPEIVDDGAHKPPSPSRLALAPDPAHPVPVGLALGRILFHAVGDARVAHDGRACASCHPDGRDDALTWSTPEGPRRSIMLAARVDNTAPYSWSGTEHTLEEHLELTFDRLHGAGGLRSLELEALETYVRSLPAPPPLPGADAAQIARGQKLFASDEVGCSKCHAGGEVTDNEHHDVQSKRKSDRDGKFNTPTLKFVGGTGPYFHDGRFATLRELLKAEDGKMGHTGQLSEADLDSLLAYVRSL